MFPIGLVFHQLLLQYGLVDARGSHGGTVIISILGRRQFGKIAGHMRRGFGHCEHALTCMTQFASEESEHSLCYVNRLRVKKRHRSPSRSSCILLCLVRYQSSTLKAIFTVGTWHVVAYWCLFGGTWLERVH